MTQEHTPAQAPRWVADGEQAGGLDHEQALRKDAERYKHMRTTPSKHHWSGPFTVERNGLIIHGEVELVGVTANIVVLTNLRGRAPTEAEWADLPDQLWRAARITTDGHEYRFDPDLKKLELR